MQPKCSVCLEEPAIKTAMGYMPGSKCAERRAKQSSPNAYPFEFCGDQVREERIHRSGQMLQPFDSAGTFSEEYYDHYGTKGVKVSAEKVKNRRRIWDKAVSVNTDTSRL
jgi:hypothetical protein